MSRSKLQRAKTAVETPRAKKPLKKHGTEISRDIFEFSGGVDGEVGSAVESVTILNHPDSSWLRSSGDTLALEPAVLSRFESSSSGRGTRGTRSMLPPSSKSTTLEHTQTSEPGAASSTQSIDTKYIHTKSRITEEGIPGSRTESPSVSSRRSIEGSAQKSDAFEGSEERSRISIVLTSNEANEPSSSASVLSPSKTITVKSRNQHGDDILLYSKMEDCESSAAFPINHTPPATVNSATLSRNSEYLGDRDELSLPTHGPETWSINQTTMSNTKKRKKDSKKDLAHELGSDDIAIGIPKDQYQPRPSRSRSDQNTEGVIVPDDFSRKPETIAKKKRKLFKKSKSTASDEIVPTDQDLGEGKNASVTNTGPVSETFDLAENADGSNYPLAEEKDAVSPLKELVAESTPSEKPPDTKKQRGRPRKVTSMKTADGDTIDKSGVENAHLDADVSKSNITVTSKKTKKDGKAKSDSAIKSEELVHDSDDELDDMNDILYGLGQTYDEVPSKCTSPVLLENPTEPTPPTKPTIQPKTPPKAETPARKGPDKHSPISNGKVTYRVGLSKRARIAPLLRIVRKS